MVSVVWSLWCGRCVVIVMWLVCGQCGVVGVWSLWSVCCGQRGVVSVVWSVCGQCGVVDVVWSLRTSLASAASESPGTSSATL